MKTCLNCGYDYYDNQNKCFILINKDKIKKYVELYKDTKVTEVTEEETRKENIKTQTTQTTQNNNNNVTFVSCDSGISKNNSDLIVQEERVIDLTNLIKDNDKGEGVSFDTLQVLNGLV